MDGENNGKPYFLMEDLGGKPTILGNLHLQGVCVCDCYFFFLWIDQSSQNIYFEKVSTLESSASNPGGFI